jgi:hypothetical protein
MPDQNVRLRAASTTLAPANSALGARLFEQTFGVHNTPEDMQSYLAESFTPERQAAELAESNRRTWIAEDTAGVAVGYAVLIRGEASQFVDGNRPAELRRIYVDRSLHGRPTTRDEERASSSSSSVSHRRGTGGAT